MVTISRQVSVLPCQYDLVIEKDLYLHCFKEGESGGYPPLIPINNRKSINISQGFDPISM